MKVYMACGALKNDLDYTEYDQYFENIITHLRYIYEFLVRTSACCCENIFNKTAKQSRMLPGYHRTASV